MGAKNKPNEIQITRIYDAPVKAVWDAWTDPKQVAQWWGPRGFTITTHSKDLRVGGHWSYTMHGPDGVDYENKTLYHEVVKHSRLVYDHGGNDDRPPLFRATVDFSETRGNTKMEMTMALATADAAAETKRFIKKAGGNATWDRLSEFLTKESTGTERFVINRSFEAPIERVFRMWTDPEHFSRWLPPTDLTMKVVRADVRPQGTLLCSMTDGHELKFHSRLHYLEVVSPHRLVYTQQFCDELERPSRHPLAPTWPETMLTKVTFAEEDAGTTRITLEWEPQGQVSREELAAFIAERGGMTQGWTGSFDKLDDVLSGAS